MSKISNTDLLKFNLEVAQLGDSKIAYDDPNAFDLVQLRTKEYYSICARYDAKPTWEGLALALGITRMTLNKWRDGQIEWVRGDISDYISHQWAFLNSYFTTGMMEGSIDKVTGIFLGKNNYGYINDDPQPIKREINVTLSVAELIEEAKNLQIDKK